MLTACVEPFPPFLDEVKPMLPRHWEELALNKDKVPLDPQYDEYLRRDAAGQILLIVMREAGKLAGYFVGFVAPGLHYQSCLTLTLDIFWIAPEHRGQMGGVRLFKAVEAEAKRRGVDRMFVGSKCHKEASFLFERLGYERVEIYYSAWLGD
ncbi:GNAT family N-acetyltransferase [Sphingobium phenoxybenzoativorans]|uniref:GNAT family N-acetyltransferase n=1 Tax=Sphingobium phenoxybenzoativorans TaxID=1592790 RepID=UPI0008734714|nr:GNAT family N-acetyltransferase [Sphingobium phenoxybenzoativorans]